MDQPDVKNHQAFNNKLATISDALKNSLARNRNTIQQRILIAENDDATQRLLRRVLARDYTLVFLEEGEHLLAEAARGAALVLLDVNLPGELNGYEVCEKLKEDKRTHEIPVIFLTSERSIQHETLGFALGAVDFLTKPAVPPIIRSRVKMHLALHHAHHQLEQQHAALLEAEKLRRDVERISHHDLKSPLNGIIGFSDFLLAEGNLSADQRPSVQIIFNSGHRLLQMINLSLYLFKMERGTYELEPQEVDLLPLLRNILEDNDTRPEAHLI